MDSIVRGVTVTPRSYSYFGGGGLNLADVLVAAGVPRPSTPDEPNAPDGAEKRVTVADAVNDAIAKIKKAVSGATRSELADVNLIFASEFRSDIEKATKERIAFLDEESRTRPFCTICQETVEDAAAVMPCGDTFCAQCVIRYTTAPIRDANQRVHRCPNCASPWNNPHLVTFIQNGSEITLETCRNIHASRH